MCYNNIRKMVSLKLGKEMKKDVFCVVMSAFVPISWQDKKHFFPIMCSI